MQYTLKISHYLSLTDTMEDDSFVSMAKDYIDVYLYVPTQDAMIEISINGEITSEGMKVIANKFDIEIEEVESFKEQTKVDRQLIKTYPIVEKDFYEMIKEMKKVFKGFVQEASLPVQAIVSLQLQINKISQSEEFNIADFEKFRLAQKMDTQLQDKSSIKKMKI